MVGDLKDRLARLTIAVPTTQSGDYTTTVLNVMTISGENDPRQPGLRLTAKIMKTLEKEPNTCEIHVYNLAPRTRQLLQAKGVKISLEAGYIGTGVTGFWSGDVRTCDHLHPDATWDTVLKCGDGERSFRYATAKGSFAPGTRASTILLSLANQTGLRIGNVNLVAGGLSTVFDQGYTVSGMAQKAIDTLLKSLGYTWSIQNGALQVLAPGQSLSKQIPDITPESGLIGSPEMGSPETNGKPQLCKFKALLTPTSPGAKVHLRSERYNTDVTVQKCEFDLDTHSGPWDTTIYGILATTR